MNDFSEKRSAKRYPIEAIVMYHIHNYPDYSETDLYEIDHPRSVDISFDGMQFVAGRDLPVGSFLKIMVYPAPAGLVLEMIGEVVWVKQVEQQMNYRVGVSFREYLSGCEQALQDVLGRIEG